MNYLTLANPTNAVNAIYLAAPIDLSGFTNIVADNKENIKGAIVTVIALIGLFFMAKVLAGTMKSFSEKKMADGVKGLLFCFAIAFICVLGIKGSFTLVDNFAVSTAGSTANNDLRKQIDGFVD